MNLREARMLNAIIIVVFVLVGVALYVVARQIGGER